MVSIDDLQEVLHGLFKEHITGPLKFKTAESHLENREILIYLDKKSSEFDEIWYTTAHLVLNDSHVTKYEFF